MITPIVFIVALYFGRAGSQDTDIISNLRFLKKKTHEYQTLQASGVAMVPDMDKMTDERLGLRKARPVTPLTVSFNYSLETLPDTRNLVEMQNMDFGSSLRAHRDQFALASINRWSEQETKYASFENRSAESVNRTLYVLPPLASYPVAGPPVFDMRLISNYSNNP